jgi:eukaryotic-like serine/threonine-protein kinase
MNLQPGTRIGPYEIIGLLGAGGMGEVYRGRDPRLGRDVAVKVLSGEFASNPDRLRRFEQEARAAAALNHPNILAVFDIGTEGAVPYLVSEFLEGQTLRDALSAGPLPFRQVLELARQISSGLTAAHTRGITHRDLKPENIFLTTDGRVKILDFGLAKWTPLTPADAHATTLNIETDAGTVFGTVGYMAPEQATGREVDRRCDQFAFGILVFEMLAGRRAFERPSRVEELARRAAAADRSPPRGPAAVAVAGQSVPREESGRTIRVDTRPAPRSRDAGHADRSSTITDARAGVGPAQPSSTTDASDRTRH